VRSSIKSQCFPCANGVIDLETGLLSQDVRKINLSLASPIEFKDINEPAPVWERTLLEIFSGSEEMVAYVQRVLGYCMTGLVEEKLFAVLFGLTGWNGRSLIVERVSHVMGTLAGSIPSKCFCPVKWQRARPVHRRTS